jgi:hypothetical protein
LTGLATSNGQPEIVGSWSGDTGLDIVFWTLHGHDWVRGTSSGTALASSERALNVIRAIGSGPTDPVIAGAVTVLGGGRVRLAPAMWRRSSVGGVWSRITLPASEPGQATGAQCEPRSCVAAGYVGSHLAIWTYDGHRAVRADLPDIAVSDSSVALVGPPGAARAEVLAAVGDRSVLMVPGSPWTRRNGPPGTPTAWALQNDRTYVLTTARDGSAALWVEGAASTRDG